MAKKKGKTKFETNRKAIIGFLLMVIVVMGVVLFAYNDALNNSQENEKGYLRDLIEVRKENLWLQDRLRDCTECNLIHYDIITECNSCRKKGMNNDRLNELYIELE